MSDEQIYDEELVEELSALEQAMTSEEHQNEGTFLTGGGLKEILEVSDEEKPLDEELILNPRPVSDGEPLLDFLRKNLHKFESPYAYIGGEINSPDRERYKTAKLRVLVARLSSYEATSLSMSHSLMAQIYQEVPDTFCDLTFSPHHQKDYNFLKDNGFSIWFGTNSKLAPYRFDVLSITHAVGMEQLSFIPLMHDSGIPIFKDQRMDRPDIPFILVGGSNSGTVAPLSGYWTDSKGEKHGPIIDAVIYGDGEEAGKIFLEVVKEGKEKGWTKRETLRACHGRVPGFYEPDCYEHEYDGVGNIVEIRHAPGREYADLPVKRATVENLDDVRTLEEKVIPFTGDGTTVDVAIAGSVGCIGSAGWGACSFCREGSEGPYRERSLPKVMTALKEATKNQGTKEVSFFSLNFNHYSDFFELVKQSAAEGYKVGLISQRVDILAETPEQIKVQRYLRKTNFTMGVEGISNRMRAYLNKNLQEWEILRCATEMMREGAKEIKLFMIVTGLEQELDVDEFLGMMEKINAIREKLGATTRFRVSFTPLFPAAFTALQFAPCNAALNHGERKLDKLFFRAKELGWGRRLSVFGEEPLLSNLINHGGRNITHLLISSHFQDNWRFIGTVPKGTWARWLPRIEADPNIDLDLIYGEKTYEYTFPWEDISYSTNKDVLWRGYVRAVAFQGSAYCVSTRTIKGICHVNECGCCDPDKDGKPNPALMKNIVGRKVGEPISPEEINQVAKAREKNFHLRVLFESTDPIYRFVLKGYFAPAIARSLMKASDRFHSAFVGPVGHARLAAGAHKVKDWTFGRNIYDFSLNEHMSESDLQALIEPANEFLREGKILDIRMDAHLVMLRNDVDYAVYSMLIPNSEISFQRIRSDVGRFFERRSKGDFGKVRVKVMERRDVYSMEERKLDGKDVRAVSYEFVPSERGTVLRMVVSANYNPLALLESITGRRQYMFKSIPVFCDGYVQLPPETNETDVFAALAGNAQKCKVTGLGLEIDIFSGKKMPSGISLAAPDGIEANFPLDLSIFHTREMRAIHLNEPVEVAAAV